MLLAADKRSLPKAQENDRNEANNLGYVYMSRPSQLVGNFQEETTTVPMSSQLVRFAEVGCYATNMS